MKYHLPRGSRVHRYGCYDLIWYPCWTTKDAYYTEEDRRISLHNEDNKTYYYFVVPDPNYPELRVRQALCIVSEE